MSYSLHSLKGGRIGTIQGTSIRDIKVDARSLDGSSEDSHAALDLEDQCPKPLNPEIAYTDHHSRTLMLPLALLCEHAGFPNSTRSCNDKGTWGFPKHGGYLLRVPIRTIFAWGSILGSLFFGHCRLCHPSSNKM